MKRNTLKTTAALTLAVGALAQPAWAVTNIETCRTITGPGCFQLTKNLNATGNCIVIAASDVSLDLRGHTIKGNDTGTGSASTPTETPPGTACAMAW